MISAIRLFLTFISFSPFEPILCVCELYKPFNSLNWPRIMWYMGVLNNFRDFFEIEILFLPSTPTQGLIFRSKYRLSVIDLKNWFLDLFLGPGPKISHQITPRLFLSHFYGHLKIDHFSKGWIFKWQNRDFEGNISLARIYQMSQSLKI